MIKIRTAVLYVALLGIMVPIPMAVGAEEGANQPERILLWDGEAPIGEGKVVVGDTLITVYHGEKPNGTAVVVCPGGGYTGLCIGGEGHETAKWLQRHGITGVVLEYRIPNGNSLIPLLDAQRAIRLVRSRASAWGCDPKKIGILGFSAGGHLASTAETHFDAGLPGDPDPVNRLSCRPDFGILVYPVITMGPKTHAGSKKSLLGDAPNLAEVDRFSNEKHVTAQTPPTFLTAAKDDNVVLPEGNSQVFYEALKAHHIPAEYLILPNGGHGLNGYHGPSWDMWQTESLKWLAGIKMIPSTMTVPTQNDPKLSRND
jgi:acetyl esterase/lipase